MQGELVCGEIKFPVKKKEMKKFPMLNLEKGGILLKLVGYLQPNRPNL